jgi:hypothetical protein
MHRSGSINDFLSFCFILLLLSLLVFMQFMEEISTNSAQLMSIIMFELPDEILVANKQFILGVRK